MSDESGGAWRKAAQFEWFSDPPEGAIVVESLPARPLTVTELAAALERSDRWTEVWVVAERDAYPFAEGFDGDVHTFYSLSDDGTLQRFGLTLAGHALPPPSTSPSAAVMWITVAGYRPGETIDLTDGDDDDGDGDEIVFEPFEPHAENMEMLEGGHGFDWTRLSEVDG